MKKNLSHVYINKSRPSDNTNNTKQIFNGILMNTFIYPNDKSYYQYYKK